MRPTLKALSDQQIEINRLNATLAFVVKAAGLENHPRTAHLFKQAEDENPAQPSGWANPAGGGTEAPAATTEEASTPAATDSPENQGGSPLTDVTPAATTSVESTETVLEEPLDLNEQDPTKPVAGTEDLGEGGRGNAGTNRTETEVRIGDPNQGDAAFNDGGFLSGTAAAERVMASLRLARLRIQAGIEAGDDLVLSQAIAASAITDEVLDAEIATLSKVVTASQARRPVSRSLVPQAPAGRTAVRARPSLSAEAAVVVPPQEISAAVTGDEVAFE